MPAFHQITLLGNCTRDPEMRFSQAGLPIGSVSLAVNSFSGSGEQRKQETCFIDVTFFGRLAEIASEYLKKGDPVLVSGRLRYETWEGQDGMKRSKHSVIAEQLQLMARSVSEDVESGHGKHAMPSQPAPADKPPTRSRAKAAPVTVSEPDPEDDIPFIAIMPHDGMMGSSLEQRKFLA